MKKLLFLPGCLMMISVICFSQSEKFIAAMEKNIAALDSGFKNPPFLLNLANNFERIALTEKKEWLPYYYAAFCQVNYGFMEKDKTKTDAYADKATELIMKADSLAHENSEISCIKSMIASCHMLVDPMQRWMQYGKESSDNIEKAIRQDSANPRPEFLKGQGLKYTPEQFGGGCITAKPVLQKSAEKFAVFKPAGSIYPNWGKERTEKLLKDCQ